MTRKRLIVAGAVLLALSAVGAAATFAAFTATTGNSDNSFSAASSFGATLRFASGTYTGNNTDNRAIGDPGFQPDLVIVKADTNQVAVARTSTMSGDASKRLDGGNALETDRIQSLTATGFQLGKNAQVNGDGVTYRWMAFRASTGALKVGSYTGGGGASQAIANVGFAPEYVALMDEEKGRAVQRFAGMSTSFRFGSGSGTAGAVSSLDSDGFTVGNADEANKSGRTYHYVAFNEVAGGIKRATYTGNATNDTDIGGVGFEPDYVMIRANDTATARQGRHRAASITGTSSQHFSGTANDATGIKALQSDGFQLGTSGNANASGVTYHYMAFKNTAGGCSLPGSQILYATADGRVEQANPATNYGTSTNVGVRSQSGSNNKRAYVQYTLPTVPAGCSVTDAKLYLYDRTPSSGRTIEARKVDASWTETGITWNNQPAASGAAATTTSPSSAGVMEWAVTAQVQQMYSGSNFGFQLRDATEDAAGGFEQLFDSREGVGSAIVVTFGD